MTTLRAVKGSVPCASPIGARAGSVFGCLSWCLRAGCAMAGCVWKWLPSSVQSAPLAKLWFIYSQFNPLTQIFRWKPLHNLIGEGILSPRPIIMWVCISDPPHNIVSVLKPNLVPFLSVICIDFSQAHRFRVLFVFLQQLIICTRHSPSHSLYRLPKHMHIKLLQR